MINLIKADLFKETKKKSFKIMSVLIIFVSILSLVIINNNMSDNVSLNEVYNKFSEKEYKSINKHGNYEEYLNDYDEYVETIENENIIISKEMSSKATRLLSNVNLYLYILGIVIVFISFHSFSYDYQKDTLKYIFQSKYGRVKIYFSKIISLILISIFYAVIVLTLMFITSYLLTGENIFNVYKYIVINNNLKKVSIIIYYLGICLLNLIPISFMIIFSMFLSILFKGGSIGLVISNIVYLFSLVFSELLFKYGFNFIKYTPLPFLDYTYLSNKVILTINNMIYNLNLSYITSFIYLIIYSVILIFISIKFLKKDV